MYSSYQSRIDARDFSTDFSSSSFQQSFQRFLQLFEECSWKLIPELFRLPYEIYPRSFFANFSPILSEFLHQLIHNLFPDYLQDSFRNYFIESIDNSSLIQKPSLNSSIFCQGFYPTICSRFSINLSIKNSMDFVRFIWKKSCINYPS